MNIIVNITHLSDQQLELFGWYKVEEDPDHILYWNPRYNEIQPVTKDPPRCLVVDDWNDAQQMSPNGFIQGPVKRRSTN